MPTANDDGADWIEALAFATFGKDLHDSAGYKCGGKGRQTPRAGTEKVGAGLQPRDCGAWLDLRFQYHRRALTDGLTDGRACEATHAL